MKFSEKLIEWYRVNKRNLPWRLTKQPYKIWVSEIILQQTRIEQQRCSTSFGQDFRTLIEKEPEKNTHRTLNTAAAMTSLI